MRLHCRKNLILGTLLRQIHVSLQSFKEPDTILFPHPIRLVLTWRVDDRRSWTAFRSQSNPAFLASCGSDSHGERIGLLLHGRGRI